MSYTGGEGDFPKYNNTNIGFLIVSEVQCVQTHNKTSPIVDRTGSHTQPPRIPSSYSLDSQEQPGHNVRENDMFPSQNH